MMLLSKVDLSTGHSVVTRARARARAGAFLTATPTSCLNFSVPALLPCQPFTDWRVPAGLWCLGCPHWTPGQVPSPGVKLKICSRAAAASLPALPAHHPHHPYSLHYWRAELDSSHSAENSLCLPALSLSTHLILAAYKQTTKYFQILFWRLAWLV